MSEQRKYIPEIGKIVKLASIYDYTQHLPTLGYWSNLKIRAIDGNQVTVEHYNAGDTGEVFTVPLAAIEKPVGWKPRYTITVAPDKVDTVLGWMKRGIVCRLSHDLNPYSMPMVFQPLDNSGQPNWRFLEVTDSVPPEECDKVFRVVKIESHEVNFVSKREREALTAEWAKEGWKVEFVGKGNQGYWERYRETVIKDWAE
jgi:hypothetical protein